MGACGASRCLREGKAMYKMLVASLMHAALTPSAVFLIKKKTILVSWIDHTNISLFPSSSNVVIGQQPYQTGHICGVVILKVNK